MAILLQILLCAGTACTAWPEPLGLDRPSSDEKDAILRTINYYYEGIHLNDLDALARAYHPQALFTYVDSEKEEVQQFPVGAYLSKLYDASEHYLQSERRLRVMRLDIEGNAALVKTRITYHRRGFRLFDYLTLLKEGGEWRIISRVSDREYAQFVDEGAEERAPSPSETRNQIKAVLRDYLHSRKASAWDRLPQVFHPSAMVAHVDPRLQVCHTASLSEYQQHLSQALDGPTFQRRGTVEHIDQEGNIAAAKIQVYYPKLDTYTVDFMSLVRVGGKWHIIQKATHKELKALAVPE